MSQVIIAVIGSKPSPSLRKPSPCKKNSSHSLLSCPAIHFPVASTALASIELQKALTTSAQLQLPSHNTALEERYRGYGMKPAR